MTFSLKKLGLSTALSTSLLLGACTVNEKGAEDNLVNGDEIDLVYVPWDSELASTNVIGKVLEEVGYEVTLTSVDSPIMWQAIATGRSDAMVSAWLPTMHAPDIEEHGDDIDHIGTNFEGARVGFVVPAYMEIDSIDELDNQVPDQRIVGIERGAGTVEAIEKALQDYGKDEWWVHASSSGAMVLELESAIKDGEPVIVTGWTPHWKFQEFDLKMLDDPLNSMGEGENIETFGRLGLEEDHPVAYQILENFYWDQEDIESVMLEIQEGVPAEVAAENFIQEHPNLIDSWLEGVEEVAGK